MTIAEDAKKDNVTAFTPYESGDHCIFYTAQDANLFFNGTGLPSEQRDAFKRSQPRTDELIRKLNLGQDTKQPASFLKRSIVSALKMLDKEGIASSGIYCAPKDAAVLSEAGFIKRRGIPVVPVDNTRNYTVPTPAIIVTERESQGDSHMWFCQSKRMWQQGHREHMNKETDSLTAVIPLERKKP